MVYTRNFLSNLFLESDEVDLMPVVCVSTAYLLELYREYGEVKRERDNFVDLSPQSSSTN